MFNPFDFIGRLLGGDQPVYNTITASRALEIADQIDPSARLNPYALGVRIEFSSPGQAQQLLAQLQAEGVPASQFQTSVAIPYGALDLDEGDDD